MWVSSLQKEKSQTILLLKLITVYESCKKRTPTLIYLLRYRFILNPLLNKVKNRTDSATIHHTNGSYSQATA